MRHLWKIILVLVLILGIVGYFRYFWVFGTAMLITFSANILRGLFN